MTHTIQVQSNEWAGTLRDGWRPAIDGTLNSSEFSADEASTFESFEDAVEFLPLVREQNPDSVRIRREDGVVVHEEEM